MAYGFWVLAASFRRSLDAKHRGYFSLIALYYGKKIIYRAFFERFGNQLIGPVHLKDEMAFQDEIFRWGPGENQT